MLNRLYIVIGLLAIIGLAAGFVLPRFIDWGGYRDRMEQIASEALGTEVEIVGEIAVTLLPQPRMTFADVIIGPPESPVAMIAGVEAEFSLIDFLRDRYRVTRLVLEQPRLELRIDDSGALQTGIWLAEEVSASNVSIEDAEIVRGMVRLTDTRTAEVHDLTQIAGALQLSAMRGPFAFTGNGIADRQSYSLRVSSSALDSNGNAAISLFVRPASEAFSLTAEGTLGVDPKPRFSGDVTYRQAPPTAGLADNVSGDLVFVSTAELDTEKLLLTAYTIVPDENRAGTRLTGAAEVTLGAEPRFSAVISGGAMALPPRDATAEAKTTPYELMRLLTELPLPPVPAIPGTVGIDITELDIRAVALRNLRVDATTDADSWTVSRLSAVLPGNTALRMSGAVTANGGEPAFAGQIALSTNRLDALAALWRKPGEGSPLFNMAGTLGADLTLGGDTLTLANGTLVLDDTEHRFAAELGMGESRHLRVAADFAALTPLQSAAVLALVPDLSTDAAFGLTFPKGELTLSAAAATVAGLEGRELALAGSWGGGVIEIGSLTGSLGGAELDLTMTVFGTLARPELFGAGSVRIADAGAAVLDLVFDATDTPPALREVIGRQVPADLELALEAPGGTGSQMLRVGGAAGVAALDIQALLGAGLIQALTGPVGATVTLASEDAAGLTAQIGLDGLTVFPDGALRAQLMINGSPGGSFETDVTLEGGGDSVVFAGTVDVADDERWTGNGILNVALSDPTPLAERLGASGLYLPALEGGSDLAFSGSDTVTLSNIDLRAAGQQVRGELQLRPSAGAGRLSGELEVGAIDLGGLVALLAGPAALVTSPDSVWPIGPLSAGEAPRTVNGRVRISTAGIFAGADELPLIGDASFDVDWDATRLQLRGLDGAMAGGRVAADIGLCCAGPLADKRLSGRITMTDTDLDALLPPLLSAALDGRLDLVAQFDGTGDSLATIAEGLTGQGNYSVAGLKVERFDPRTFEAIAELDNLLEIEADVLTPLVAEALARGPFTVPQAAGGFTIAGGVVRSPNLALEGDGVRLFGGASIRLATLGLEGAYSLTPVGTVDEEGVINETTSRITAVLAGTLTAPEERLDLAPMVDGIKVRAYEIELEELERLRAEDEARIAAFAEQRAQDEAEEAARIEAETAAARGAALAAATAQSARIAAAVAAARSMAEDGAAAVATARVAAAPEAQPSPVETADGEQTQEPVVAPQEVAPQPAPPPRVFLAPLNLTPTESPNQF